MTITQLENERAEKFIKEVKAGEYSDPVLKMRNVVQAKIDGAGWLHYLWIGYTPQNPERRKEFWCKATPEEFIKSAKEHGLNVTAF